MSTAHFRLHLNVLVVAIGVGMCWNETNLHQEISQRLIAPVHAAWNASLLPLHLICNNKRRHYQHTNTIYRKNSTEKSFAVRYDIKGNSRTYSESHTLWFCPALGSERDLWRVTVWCNSSLPLECTDWQTCHPKLCWVEPESDTQKKKRVKRSL